MTGRVFRLLAIAIFLALLATPLFQNVSIADDAGTPVSPGKGIDPGALPVDTETPATTEPEPPSTATPWSFEIAKLSGDCLGNVTALLTVAQETHAMLAVLDANTGEVVSTQDVVISAGVDRADFLVANPLDRDQRRYRLRWTEPSGTLREALSDVVSCATPTPAPTTAIQATATTDPGTPAAANPTRTAAVSAAAVNAAAVATFIPNTGGIDFTFSTNDGSALPTDYALCPQYGSGQCVTIGPGTQTLTNLPVGPTDFVLSGPSQSYAIDPVTVYVTAGINVPISVVLNHFDTASVIFHITTADGGPLPDSITAHIDWHSQAAVVNGTATFSDLRVGQHSYQISIGGPNPAYDSAYGNVDVSANSPTTVNVVLRPLAFGTFEFAVTTSDGGALGTGWQACFSGKGASMCAPVVDGIATIADMPDNFPYMNYGIYNPDNPSERAKYEAAYGGVTFAPNTTQHIPIVLQRRSGSGAIVVHLDTSDGSVINPKMQACVYSSYDAPARYSLCLPYEGGDIVFPNVSAGDFDLSVEYRTSPNDYTSPYESVGHQSVHVDEGQTITVSQTLVPILYGNAEVTVLTDDGSTPPAGYQVCLDNDCAELTQTGVPISIRGKAGSQTLTVQYAGNAFIPPYNDVSMPVTIAANETLQTTVTLRRIAYIPVHVTITDSKGSPVTDHLEFKMNGQYTYPYNGGTTVWVEADSSYRYTVYAGQKYRDVSGWVDVPPGATEYSLAIQLEAYPTGTFTLNLPSDLPAPSSSNSPTSNLVTLSDDTYKTDFVPLTNGTTGPITWRSGEVNYSYSYNSADGYVLCNGTFTNAVGGNVTIPMDCTYTPDPTPTPSPTSTAAPTNTPISTVAPTKTATATSPANPTKTSTTVPPETPTTEATGTTVPATPANTATSVPTEALTPAVTASVAPTETAVATETSTAPASVVPTSTSAPPTAVPTGTSEPTAEPTEPATGGTVVVEIPWDAILNGTIPAGADLCLESTGYQACQPVPSPDGQAAGSDLAQGRVASRNAFAEPRALLQTGTATITFTNVPAGTYAIVLRVPGHDPVTLGSVTAGASGTVTAIVSTPDPEPTVTPAQSDQTPTATVTAVPTKDPETPAASATATGSNSGRATATKTPTHVVSASSLPNTGAGSSGPSMPIAIMLMVAAALLLASAGVVARRR